MVEKLIELHLNEDLVKLIRDNSIDESKFVEDIIFEFNKSQEKNEIKLVFELEKYIEEKTIITKKDRNYSKDHINSFTQKSTIMLLVLSLLAAGSAFVLGMEYKRAKTQSITGNTNTIVSTALTIDSISVSANLDDSSVAAISEDGLTFIWGVQANNGDIIDAQITLKNNANSDIVALISAESVNDIELKFSGTKVGKVDESEWLVSIPGASGGMSGYKTFTQTLEIRPDAEPGFYKISTSIDSTSLKGLNTS